MFTFISMCIILVVYAYFCEEGVSGCLQISAVPISHKMLGSFGAPWLKGIVCLFLRMQLKINWIQRTGLIVLSALHPGMVREQ